MSNGIVSEYDLERYALGELAKEDAEKIDELASSDPALRAALEAIGASNRDILSLYPPASVKADLLARMSGTRRRTIPAFSPRRMLILSSALAAALAFLILIHPGLKKERALNPYDPGRDESLVKGIPGLDFSKTQLMIHRKTNRDVELLSDGRQAKAGDLLQLAYVAVREPYGVILSVDGRGEVTLHHPVEGGGSTALILNKKTLLPNAIELDDSPGFERFFFITSDRPIDVGEVLKRAQVLAQDGDRAKRGKMDLPEGLRQSSILILKGEGS